MSVEESQSGEVKGVNEEGAGIQQLVNYKTVRECAAKRTGRNLHSQTRSVSQAVGEGARITWWRAAWVFGRPVRSQGQCGPATSAPRTIDTGHLQNVVKPSEFFYQPLWH
eukprot:GHVT01080825.1.p2 GENE.GHVT01080825.1~~GHVT01080825.1.p2  ORF type:complete len:110 (-),score=3.60 GHVT01080825.1:1099-1428(-)